MTSQKIALVTNSRLFTHSKRSITPNIKPIINNKTVYGIGNF